MLTEAQNHLLLSNVIAKMKRETELEKEVRSLKIKNGKLRMELLYGKCTKYI